MPSENKVIKALASCFRNHNTLVYDHFQARSIVVPNTLFGPWLIMIANGVLISELF